MFQPFQLSKWQWPCHQCQILLIYFNWLSQMSLNNGRKLRIWSMNNTSGWYTKMLDKKSQKMKDTWYILEDLNAYFTYFLLLVPRSLGLFMGYTNFTLIQDHQDVLNYFWMFVNLMKDFSVIKWPKESNQTKVPFIYYISICIAQHPTYS